MTSKGRCPKSTPYTSTSNARLEKPQIRAQRKRHWARSRCKDGRSAQGDAPVSSPAHHEISPRRPRGRYGALPECDGPSLGLFRASEYSIATIGSMASTTVFQLVERRRILRHIESRKAGPKSKLQPVPPQVLTNIARGNHDSLTPACVMSHLGPTKSPVSPLPLLLERK